MRKAEIDRRHVVAGLAALGAAPVLSGVAAHSAHAGASVPQPSNADQASIWKNIAELSQQAQRMGLAVPRMSAQASATSDGYGQTLPALVDLMDSITASAPDATGVSSAELDALLEQASELLRTARQSERMPRDIPTAGAKPVVAPAFDDIAESYRKLFASCVVSPEKASEVGWYTSKILDADRRKAYEQVTEETCVPWYFVGIIHGMECGFDLRAHLHNGDSLKRKTVQVPAGRPDPWNPPSDWVTSAVDAMRYDKFHEKADWDLAKVLYRWEAYNGWRSRVLYNINTPYLWSYSNHYTKGKFVADGVWDATAVSKQCGAAVMLKALVDAGALKLPQ